MCQIISFVVNNSSEQTQKYIENQKKLIKDSLIKKGGESFSFFAVNEIDPENYILEYCDSASRYGQCFEKFLQKVSTASDIISQSDDDELQAVSWAFVFFSRQAPEMELENGDVGSAPYLVNNKLVWMHGTIANIPEIEKALGINIKVDSEALAYAGELWDKYKIKPEGVYLGLVFDISDFLKNTSEDFNIMPTNVNEYFDIFYNGIGLWLYRDINYSQVDSWYTTDSSLDMCAGYLDKIERCGSSGPGNWLYSTERKKDVIYVAYSGGMDITLSLYTFLKDNIEKVYGNLEMEHAVTHTNKEVKLIYFDYGARARKQEISALNNYYEFLKKEFLNIKFSVEIYDVRDIFKQLSKFSKYESKLIKENSQGEEAETESNLAYVPYRNTEFGLILGALIDRDLEMDKTIDPYVLFGLNLTELGVYVDNTEAWLESIVRTIGYGGKKYKEVKGLAPFINTTKTNMIAFMIKTYGYNTTNRLLNIAFSCYYPTDDGQPCGKCGSCILREKAVKRAIKRLKFDKIVKERRT